MPHPAVLAAIVVGGVAALGLAIYKQLQEQDNYYQYQRNFNEEYHRQQRNAFRHSNDFELDQDFMADDDKEQQQQQHHHHDPCHLHHDTTQLRSRKPFTNDVSDVENSSNTKKSNTSSLDQDQFELAELENSIAERKRRLMAEQAFLDREEENIRNRRMELKREEEQGFYMAAASSPNEERTSITTHPVLDPFANHFAYDNNDDSDDDDSFYQDRHENASSSGENTAILINSKREESEQESSVKSDQHHMSSSNLQFPDASQIIVTDSDATSTSRAVSDSEESWDAVSENEWARQSDSEYEH